MRMFIAACVFITICTHPALSDNNQQVIESSGKSPQTIERSLQAIQVAVERLISSIDDKGCPFGNEDRTSDLCAQWKAADAATDSAKWTGWSVFFGGLTLIAAGLAANYARKAADYARSSVTKADESNKIAASGIRPWLKISLKPAIGVINEEGLSFYSEAEISNIGKSVARNILVEEIIDAPPTVIRGGGRHGFVRSEKAAALFAKRSPAEGLSYSLLPGDKLFVKRKQNYPRSEWLKTKFDENRDVMIFHMYVHCSYIVGGEHAQSSVYFISAVQEKDSNKMFFDHSSSGAHKVKVSFSSVYDSIFT